MNIISLIITLGVISSQVLANNNLADCSIFIAKKGRTPWHAVIDSQFRDLFDQDPSQVRLGSQQTIKVYYPNQFCLYLHGRNEKTTFTHSITNDGYNVYTSSVCDYLSPNRTACKTKKD